MLVGMSIPMSTESGHASDAVVVLVTVPTVEVATRIAEALVGEGLAACVNVLPEVTSIYRWKGAVERERELLCVIKSRAARFEALRARVVSLHPYELPEVIALPIAFGHAPYLEWLVRESSG
jgi:periplasmic divalent cation tolerance protein